MSAPVSTYAPFVDCPACAGLGIVPEQDDYWTPCEHCDGTGRFHPPLEPKLHIPAVEGRHLLYWLGAFALILAGFVYVTRAWEWWDL